jgi:hypothetical protein
MNGIPSWLAKQLGGVHRSAGLRLCNRCGAPILVGLDADVAALTAHTDPDPIDTAGEVLALLAGRTTYDLAPRAGGRRQLDYRAAWNIKAQRRYPVLVSHSCGRPIPTPPPQPVIRRTRKAEQQHAPPF